MIYKIGEIAKMLNVSTESLRSWERQSFIPKPHRRPTDQREYTDEDIKAIQAFLIRRRKCFGDYKKMPLTKMT